MYFSNPTWLWGLTGLIIPIAIHLLSRKEGKLIKIGSVRHLENTSTNRFKHIKLNEYLLLLLRCFAIVILVLIFSELQWPILNEGEKWLLVENGLENEPEFVSLIDSLKRNDFRMKLLASGFPDFDDIRSATKKVNYWNLLEELKTKPVKQAVVLAFNYAGGFKGKRLSLPDHVQWIVKDPDAKKFVLRSTQVSNDSVVLRRGESSSERTSFRFEKRNINSLKASLNSSDSVSIDQPLTISISIYFDSAFLYDAEIVTAAIQAIDDLSPDSFVVTINPSAKYSSKLKTDWVIFLSRDIPAIEHHNIQLRDLNDFNRQNFYQIENKNDHRTWILTQPLTEEIVLLDNLTLELFKILRPNSKYVQKAAEFDRRVLPEKMSWMTEPTMESTIPNRETALRKYLVIILLLGLFLERWISYRRNQ